MSNPAFYFDILYPFQDKVLEAIHALGTGFYLTGGTAASRGYLHHRFSDDIDLFVNDDEHFGLWSERIIQTLARQDQWNLSVGQKEERFTRLSLAQRDLTLKIELINDFPARSGKVSEHPILGCLDSAENILSNKITALIDREEPKDMADIWGFCCQMGLSLGAALSDAQGKAAGIFPADLARLLCSATHADWKAVRWINPPAVELYLAQLNELGEKLLLPG